MIHERLTKIKALAVFASDALSSTVYATGEPPQFAYPAVHSLTIFPVLRAFSGGCAALTGVEAIGNGVPAFKPPEARNAAGK